MMLLPLPSAGSSCWTRKKGARTLTANRLSKSSTVVSSMVADRDMGTQRPRLGAAHHDSVEIAREA